VTGDQKGRRRDTCETTRALDGLYVAPKFSLAAPCLDHALSRCVVESSIIGETTLGNIVQMLDDRLEREAVRAAPRECVTANAGAGDDGFEDGFADVREVGALIAIASIWADRRISSRKMSPEAIQ
jgi:hypothetical protein